jgi:hypothetical protein
MKILAVSDVELGFIYNPQIAQRFKDVDLVISCGDLPYYYLEFMISMLDVPLYYVRGNHASKVESGVNGDRTEPWGAVDLHRRAVRDEAGLLLAGLEGSLRYNDGPNQYTQGEMWLMCLLLTPQLFLNRIRHGRYLDILVTHAPPFGIHDRDDRPHQGLKAFNWLNQVFQPTLHLHGHIHVYRQQTITETQVNQTWIMNTFGYREFKLQLPPPDQRGRSIYQKEGKRIKS